MTVTVLAGALVLAVTPTTTTPASTVPDVDVTPGVWGFIAIAAVAVATIGLVVDMTRRIRRTRYRAEIRERLEAEERGELPVDHTDPRYDGIRYETDADERGRADVGDDTERG